MRSPRPIAFALCALFALAAAGPARAQGGIWSTIQVPGTSVGGVADGDSGQVLIAGSNGAHRFDGFRMRRLPIFSTTTDSLSGNAVLRARNGDLWFAHRDGVVRLAADGSVSRYDATSGLGNSSDSEARCLAESPDGTIWVGTRQGGLSKFDGTGWTTLTTDNGLPSQSVAALGVDPRDGSMWAGCFGSTTPLAHIVGGTITNYGPFSSAAGPNVRCVAPTLSGRVWFGTDGTIGSLEGGSITEFATGTIVSAIAQGANGEVWFGSVTRGVGRFDNGVVTFLPSGPPSSSILSLYVDPAGVLWTGTSVGLGRYEGAAVLNLSTATGMPAGFTGISTLRDAARDAPGDSIDQRGVEWIGVQQLPFGLDFLNVAQRVNGQVRLFGTADGLPGGQANALAPADSGQVWIGTSNPSGPSGLARMTLDGVVREVWTAGLPSQDVLSLRRAGAGEVWVGTGHGVALVGASGVRPLRTGPGAVPDAAIRGLDLDAQGRLWIATGPTPVPDGRQGGGVVRFDPADSSFVAFTQASSGLPTNNLTSVAVFQNGDVWLGSGLGAIRLVGNAATTLTTAQGLPSNIVPRVAEGPNGEAWIATAAGLVQYDGVNATVYNVGDGLAGGALNNVFADSLGVMASLRLDGVALLNVDRTPPRAEIQTAPAPATGARDAVFGLRGGDLDSGTRGLLLAYQLDGQAQTPFAEDVTAARFPGLPDGDHSFRVWAKDRALNQAAAPETWNFTVDATAPRPIVSTPAFNDIVRDTVDVLGSVADARFAGYTIETRAEGTQRWDTLLVSPTLPAAGDTLYRWNTKSVLDGVWELRVGSSDNLGLTGYVQVTVTVDNLAPSASVTSPAKVDHVQGGRVFTTFGEVELDVPPNAWPADQIVVIDRLRQPTNPPAGLPPGAIWGDSWMITAGDPTLDKPATLILSLAGIPNVPAALYRVEIGATDTTLVPLGGARAADGASISTTISSLGSVVVLYGASVAAGAGYSGARGLDCQPRVLSPNGGGYDTRLAISFDLGKSGNGAVKVFDRAGRLVREVVEDGAFTPGRNVVFWDGKDASGRVVPSGLYVVAVRFDGETSVASIAVANR
jgi:ligand-binding sensor domain-containing protein